MEKQFALTYNGQAVQQQDFDLLGEVSGLADDRVHAELFRMVPYGSAAAKGILPYGYNGSGDVALVVGNGASGSVLVNPFRAFVGSRTAVGTEARKNWRDIRSALSVAEGATALTTPVSLSANSSGDNRIDLIYAAVSVDVADPDTVERKVKDVDTLVVTTQEVSQSIITTLELGVVEGTPTDVDEADSYPEVPADAAGVYYIPLAYVLVPDGADETTEYERVSIAEVAPVLHLADSTGATTIEPANQQYTPDRLIGFLSGNPARCFIPSTLSGGKTLLVAQTFTGDPGEFDQDAVVDDRDWRGRLVRWTAQIVDSTTEFCWETGSSDGDFPGQEPDSSANDVVTGFGNTIVSSGHRDVVVLTDDDSSIIPSDAAVRIYVNKSDGKLRIKTDNDAASQAYRIFVWLEFSGVVDNAPGGA